MTGQRRAATVLNRPVHYHTVLKRLVQLPDAKTLPERIRSLERLTPSEARIAQYFHSAYPSVAFDTPTSISEKTGVSKATVVRFISRLGYRGFSDFQENLRREVVRRLNRPIDRFTLSKHRGKDRPADYLGHGIENVLRDARELHARNTPERLWAAARMMADPERALYVVGQHSSFGLAHHFWCRAVYLRSRTYLIDNLAAALPQQMMEVGRGDVLLAITHRDYSRQSLAVARYFVKRGGRVVVLTDREDAPAAHLADVLLVGPTSGVEMFESRVGSLILLQALVAALADLLEGNIYRRWEVAEEAFRELGSFAAEPVPWIRGEGARGDGRED